MNMQTAIRPGKLLFYGDQVFSHGLSRSGYFNKRESSELEMYGETFLSLSNGSLAPENDEEKQFIEAVQSTEETSLYPAKLWKKYLHAVAQSKIHHGFAKSSQKDIIVEPMDVI